MERKKKRVTKNNFNLKDEYKESLKYIQQSRNFIYIIIGIFIFFDLIWFFIPTPEYLSEKIFEFIQELLEKTRGLSQSGLIKFILFNNLQSSFLGILFGVAFGIFPIVGAISNGYLIGFVSAYVAETGGAITLLNLLPHGIFELPAIFIALGLGLKFGTFIFQKDKFEKFLDYFWNSLRVFILVILPLLIVAAIIEGTLIFLN